MAPANGPLISFRDVWKKFGSQPVLVGATLDVFPDEALVIIGRSGCGKSVLLKHVIGLLKPDAGSILVDGREITTMEDDEILEVRRMFGMVFQGAALFDSMTVAENVGFALSRYGNLSPAEVGAAVEEKLRAVGLSGVGEKRPAELSGGMRKRVGLARALMLDPKVVLYDEPTTGLDPIMADAINDLIIETGKRLGVVSVVVTHDMVSAYKIGTRIAMLHEGKVRQVGTPDEIRNSPDEVVQQFITGRAQGPINVLGMP